MVLDKLSVMEYREGTPLQITPFRDRQEHYGLNKEKARAL